MTKQMKLSVIPMMFLASAAFSSDQVSVTVYNDHLGLIRMVQPGSVIKEGASQMRLTDVASQIDPTSVHFKSLTAPDKLTILEQNYEYDLVDSNKVLQKYIDQTILIYTNEGKQFEGKLLSASDNIVLEKKDGGIQTVSKSAVQNIDFPKLPLGLITRPTLVWKLLAEKGGLHDLEISYLTNGMDWHAEYTAVLDKDDKKADLSAWVSIANNSGATYEDAKIKLVAGHLHRASDDRPIRLEKGKMFATSMEAADQFEEKVFFEYHLYTLNRQATLKNSQNKQITLFPTATAPVKKIYEFASQTDPKRVNVIAEFSNSKADGLGMALPAGKVRMYKQDSDKAQEFVGEDWIEHTPKDEKVRLRVGHAFDLTGEWHEKDMKQLSQKAQQRTYEIRLRNHKDSDVEILVSEKLWGDWKITSSNFPHIKKDSATAEFTVPVKKKSETVLDYTVTILW